MRPQWYVYVAYSVSTGRLYCGIAKDPQRRLLQHNGQGNKGAKATRYGRPWGIVYTKGFGTKGEALKHEAYVKRLARPEKLILAGIAA